MYVGLDHAGVHLSCNSLEHEFIEFILLIGERFLEISRIRSDLLKDCGNVCIILVCFDLFLLFLIALRLLCQLEGEEAKHTAHLHVLVEHGTVGD